LYNALAIPALIHGSENCTSKAKDARITAAEMKYMRKTAGSTWTEYKAITEMTKEQHNLIFGQNTGIHKKQVATYKHYRG
jgi:uncharacterized protein YigE (DUF2233 family)